MDLLLQTTLDRKSNSLSQVTELAGTWLNFKSHSVHRYTVVRVAERKTTREKVARQNVLCAMTEEDAIGRKLWPTSDARSVITLKELSEHLLCPGRGTLEEGMRPIPEIEVAFGYACWTIQSGLNTNLSRFLDFVTSDKTSRSWSPRKMLVGTLRAAMLVNSSSAVRYILNYARAKWSDEDLRDVANCLSGECDCFKRGFSFLSFPECCAWPWLSGGEIFDGLPFTILASFFMARTEVTDLLVGFVESLGVKFREKLWPHLDQQDDDDVGPPERLLRAASRGDDEEVKRLLAEGVDPMLGEMHARTGLAERRCCTPFATINQAWLKRFYKLVQVK